VAGPSLSEKVLLLEHGFREHGIPHAFGGALALAYYATPRATIDIDVNVFVRVDRADEVLALLEELGAEPLLDDERARLDREEQIRVRWSGTPVDLFFSYDAFHDSCFERRRRMPCGDGEEIHVLAAEDLLVFKVLFDRDKDWRDIEELIFAQADDLDARYARDWLARIVGHDDARAQRFLALLDRHG
jgi:hypothetical protein